MLQVRSGGFVRDGPLVLQFNERDQGREVAVRKQVIFPLGFHAIGNLFHKAFRIVSRISLPSSPHPHAQSEDRVAGPHTPLPLILAPLIEHSNRPLTPAISSLLLLHQPSFRILHTRNRSTPLAFAASAITTPTSSARNPDPRPSVTCTKRYHEKKTRSRAVERQTVVLADGAQGYPVSKCMVSKCMASKAHGPLCWTL